jgi:hypothetical protein
MYWTREFFISRSRFFFTSSCYLLCWSTHDWRIHMSFSWLCYYECSIIMLLWCSSVFFKLWIQEYLSFEFFFLRLLEDLMLIAYLYTSLTMSSSYSLTEYNQELIFLCMIAQISELMPYYYESCVLSIWHFKKLIYIYKIFDVTKLTLLQSRVTFGLIVVPM